jgi:anti-anti-sigma regulatory factor
MEITTERATAGVAVIALDGELDGSNFDQVIDAGRAAHAAGARRVVLDLSNVTYMGSSGLVAIHSIALLLAGQEPTSPEDGWQAIHDINQSVGDGDAGVLLAGPQGSVQRVLDRSGMAELFPVHLDRDSALAAASA